MNINKYLLQTICVVMVLLTLPSCNAWLDEPKPQNDAPLEEVLRTTDDLEAMIVGAYSANGFSSENAFGGTLFLWPDLLADHVIRRKETFDASYWYVYTRRLNIEGNGVIGIVMQWLGIGVNKANLVIEAIDNGSINDGKFQEQKDRLKGEALFLRALANFEIVKMIGQQWPHRKDEWLGTFYRTKPVKKYPDDIPFARLTLTDTYDAIIKDLKEAEILLPLQYNSKVHPKSYQVRATSYAASALLAKVYWQRNEFEQCYNQINKVIGSIPGYVANFPLDEFPETPSPELLPVTFPPFSRTGIIADKGEVIFEFVAIAGQTGPSSPTRSGRLIHRFFTGNNALVGLNEQFLVDAQFSQRRDKRFLHLIQRTGDGLLTRKWDLNDMNIPVIRSSELVLMRAECLAFMGKIKEAQADLYLIKKRAGIADLASERMSDNKLLLIVEIRKERVREMFTEGVRSNEIKRIGAFKDYINRGTPVEYNNSLEGVFKSGNRSQEDFPDNIQWSSSRLIWNIPVQDLQLNHEAVANPQ